jgi:hypothetical protein
MFIVREGLFDRLDRREVWNWISGEAGSGWRWDVK